VQSPDRLDALVLAAPAKPSSSARTNCASALSIDACATSAEYSSAGMG
jgi:hypothetical protein